MHPYAGPLAGAGQRQLQFDLDARVQAHHHPLRRPHHRRLPQDLAGFELIGAPYELVHVDYFKTDGRARFAGHSAFEDPTTPPGARRRESIEVRMMAFF